ncbi:TraB/GumN family protein [Marivita hallyeonensis]|uniref:TraB family protein n=1 Tax=Marivita hallyeonensis TaxID=996342 RepID=A0A1M5XF33_9RHOB|nr:TraB/GumN family protein [Marivita hallyeonensis]SHH98114.1 hypothetical protein SAMN05443551_3888 [Marivita hallyeonensis]
MIRLLALLCLLCFAQPALAECDGTDLRTTLTDEERAQLAAELDGVPFPAGNHWRATRDGRDIHLIGTMHLSDPRLDAPVERLRGVVERADLLLLEMTQEDEEALQTRLASDPSFLMLMLMDTTLPELLAEEQWQQMSEALSARGIPPFVASRFQPWYVSMLLAIPPCVDLETMSGSGMDARLQAIARAAGIPRAALEDAATIFAAFTEQPQEMQIDMMLSALVEPGVSEDLFETLLASYFDEAPAEGWAVSTILAERYSPIDPDEAAAIFGVMEEQLLVDRNRAWIPVLVDASQTHETVVAAFGAAHLPGADGVLALLEAEGFTLERLPF